MKKILVFLMVALFPSFAAAQKDKIDEINAKTALIKSLTSDLEIVIARRAARFTLNGKLYYEKDKNLRVINHNATDSKFMSDIGSNGSEFWFYARRINPNYLFYSSYSKIHKTNLHNSLDPNWMIESLNLGKIETRKAKVEVQGQNIVVIQSRVSPRQENVFRVVVVDPQKPAVTANYVYDSNGRVLASARVNSFYTTTNNMYVPKTMEVSSVDEEATLSWRFSNIKFNVPISADTFKMPNLSVQKVDLGKGGTVVRGVND